MQLQLLTSSIETGLRPVSDFTYLIDLARCTKCTMFVALKATNKLYGYTGYDCGCMHEVDIPFLLNTDLAFRVDMILLPTPEDPNIGKAIENPQRYFIPKDFDWVLLPEYYWEAYIGGDLVLSYENSQYMIMDKTTKKLIPQVQMYKFRREDDFDRVNMLDQLEKFIIRQRTLLPPIRVDNLESDPNVRKVFDNKTGIGRVLCSISNESVDVAFYLFKSMFSLAKSDTLSMDIAFDSFETSTFMATFIPKRKRNVLKYNTYGIPFQEKIYCMYINLARDRSLL